MSPCVCQMSGLGMGERLEEVERRWEGARELLSGPRVGQGRSQDTPSLCGTFVQMRKRAPPV